MRTAHPNDGKQTISHIFSRALKNTEHTVVPTSYMHTSTAEYYESRCRLVFISRQYNAPTKQADKEIELSAIVGN